MATVSRKYGRNATIDGPSSLGSSAISRVKMNPRRSFEHSSLEIKLRPFLARDLI